MEAVLVLRWLHLLGATVLIGTGAGIAFFMLMAHRTGDPRHIAQTATTVVIADWLFTATAVIAQPITGILLALNMGWDLTETWILLSLGLYVFIGLCWLPVVWLQYRLRQIAEQAAESGSSLPPKYFKTFRTWFCLGIPAFASILTILWLMIARSTFN